MPGFYITNFVNQTVHDDSKHDNIIIGRMDFDNYYIKRMTVNKFLNDKAFCQDNEYIIVIEGVLLNKKMLFHKYKVDYVSLLVRKMYEFAGEDFFSEFRGSFSGALYIKSEKKWIVFTNHYGDNTVFYSLCDGFFLVGSQISDLLGCLSDANKKVTINEEAVYSMLTYGYMHNEFTYINEIQRLLPGHYFVFQEGNIEIKQYFNIKPGKYDFSNVSEDELIDQLDILFRQAVKLEYDKDIEYGYSHITQLSGGLDSRMCLWVANDLGYKDITCMTFSQSNSLDDIIAREIAKDLSLQIIVWPMDSARHLTHIDEYISMNYGLALYGGVGAEQEILSALNTSRYGLMHSGQIGDVVVGCFLNNESELNDFSSGGMYSSIFDADVISNTCYYDREEYFMFVRAFLGCLSSHLYTRNYTEVASPFLNVELFEFCMSIPIDCRANHSLYIKWIKKKYPEAAEYIWEKLGYRITDGLYNIIARKIKNMLTDPYIIFRKVGIRNKKTTQNIVGMNPYDLWWSTNEILRNTYNEYFYNHINKIEISSEMKDKIIYCYANGNVNEKMMAITSVAALTYYTKVD